MNIGNVSLGRRVIVSSLVIAALAISSSMPRQAAAQTCVGDCDDSGMVTVDEIITMVNIALGTADIDACEVADSNGDGMVTVDEIVTATNNALNGCPPPSGCQTTTTVTVSLNFDPSAIPAIAGLELNLDYPDLVGIPGSVDEASVVERVTDISGTFGSAAIVDLDSNTDGTDDRIRTVYLASDIPIAPGGFETVRFDCEGSEVPAPEDFVCAIPLASDQSGLAIEGVSCSVEVTVP